VFGSVGYLGEQGHSSRRVTGFSDPPSQTFAGAPNIAVIRTELLDAVDE